MLHATRGIVLRTTKYGETSLIAHILTEKFGLQSYMINGARVAKAKTSANLFQPLTLLSLITYHKETSGIQRIKEVKVEHPFTSISFNIIKSSIGLFIAEVIYRTTKQQQSDTPLFDFVYNSILLLDMQESNVVNFHLVFLMQLSKHLGIYPNDTQSIDTPFFDVQTGQFCETKPHHTLYMDSTLSTLFSQLMATSFEQQHLLTISTAQRQSLLNSLLTYYEYHLDNMGTIHAHKILQEVLA